MEKMLIRLLPTSQKLSSTVMKHTSEIYRIILFFSLLKTYLLLFNTITNEEGNPSRAISFRQISL